MDIEKIAKELEGTGYYIASMDDIQKISEYHDNLKKLNILYKNALELIINEPDNFSKSGYLKIKEIAKNATQA